MPCSMLAIHYERWVYGNNYSKYMESISVCPLFLAMKKKGVFWMAEQPNITIRGWGYLMVHVMMTQLMTAVNQQMTSSWVCFLASANWSYQLGYLPDVWDATGIDYVLHIIRYTFWRPSWIYYSHSRRLISRMMLEMMHFYTGLSSLKL